MGSQLKIRAETVWECDRGHEWTETSEAGSDGLIYPVESMIFQEGEEEIVFCGRCFIEFLKERVGRVELKDVKDKEVVRVG